MMVLKKSREKQSYSVEFKRNVVKLYLTEEWSYQDLANNLGIRNPSIICTWVGKYRKHGLDNLIKRNFKSPSPHQKITTDTSEFKYYTTDDKANTRIGKLYLNTFLDMYNSEIISYSISKRPTMQAILDPLKEAIKITSDCKERIFHSEQGWGYQVKQYTKILKNME